MAGKSEGTGALYKGKHFSRKDKMRITLLVKLGK